MEWTFKDPGLLQDAHPLTFSWVGEGFLPVFVLNEDNILYRMTPLPSVPPGGEVVAIEFFRGNWDSSELWKEIVRLTNPRPSHLARHSYRNDLVHDETLMVAAGLAVNHRSLAEWRELGQMHESTLGAGRMYDLSMASLRLLDRFAMDLQSAFLDAVKQLQFKKNHIREMIAWLYDLEESERSSFVRMLEEKAASAPGDGLKQTRERLLAELQKMKFPMVTTYKEQRKKLLSELDLPSEVRLEQPVDFESDEMQMTIRFRTTEELTRAAYKIADKKNLTVTKKILDLNF